ncbi:Motile sperm domain-containing protein 2 [Pseudolycoriella hygida]|uniref:Motile sperm domain-containing protein 2 n=1 Tax=Pseudolycoriella hygida TaxID=35572 RepID=A0A9Q0N4I2_9DIPT|nr:Motile sperm domain-containing protein 2 [Pseudolycoriella hygida]
MTDQMGNNSFSEKTDGTMLQINPQDAILFTKAGNELVGMVEITNIIQAPVTYKIKTTSPEKFRVRPSTGILAPGSNAVINVVLQQGHQMPLLSKDKFLVMCMELSSDTSTTSHDIAELWKNTASFSSQVEQHRLKCWMPTSTQLANDTTKNGSLYTSTFESDRQGSHFASTVSQLVTTTNRLESQIKFNQTLQWVTLVVVILLSVAVVYILKMEIKNSNGEYCTSMHRN